MDFVRAGAINISGARYTVFPWADGPLEYSYATGERCLKIFSEEIHLNGDARSPPAPLRALASALSLTQIVNKDGTFAYFYSERLPSNTDKRSTSSLQMIEAEPDSEYEPIPCLAPTPDLTPNQNESSYAGEKRAPTTELPSSLLKILTKELQAPKRRKLRSSDATSNVQKTKIYSKNGNSTAKANDYEVTSSTKLRGGGTAKITKSSPESNTRGPRTGDIIHYSSNEAYSISQVKGDGNCLIHSINLWRQLEGLPDIPPSVFRKRLTNFIEENDVLQEPYKSDLTRILQRPYEWLPYDTAPSAIAKLLDRNNVILTTGHTSTQRFYSRFLPNRPTYFILYHNPSSWTDDEIHFAAAFPDGNLADSLSLPSKASSSDYYEKISPKIASVLMRLPANNTIDICAQPSGQEVCKTIPIYKLSEPSALLRYLLLLKRSCPQHKEEAPNMAATAQPSSQSKSAKRSNSNPPQSLLKVTPPTLRDYWTGLLEKNPSTHL